MSSVRNRILQFQQQSGGETDFHVPFFATNGQVKSLEKRNSKDSRDSRHGIIDNRSEILPEIKSRPNSISGNSNSTSNNTNFIILSNGSNQLDMMSSIGPQPKKTTMTINLASSVPMDTSLNKPIPSQNRSIGVSRLPRTSPTASITSAIPKLISPVKSPTAPIIEDKSIYANMNWKEKFEDSERKRQHIVTLAQKATRDYEELRRRYQDLSHENDKLTQRHKEASIQLEALRKASEGAYHEYYRLKKHYQIENTAKTQALSRVDEYNKENRILKRQSAALLQHFGADGSSGLELEQLMETQSRMSTENTDDKEIQFLRSRTQEMESRMVELESELEKTKLAEFESQEAAMFINDSVQVSMNKIKHLKKQIQELNFENGNLNSCITELRMEIENLKSKQNLVAEKLHSAEIELRKVKTEKNVLQRQSIVLFSNTTLNSQLEDALKQISDLEFQLEEQKLNYETQILEVQESVQHKESILEAMSIHAEVKVKSLEDLVDTLKKKLEETQETVETNFTPPPPPPLPCLEPPPRPPPPPPFSPSPECLSAAVQSVTLRRRKEPSPAASPESKAIVTNTSPQIDSVVSQIKKGIKLRSTENSKTLTRKETEADGKPAAEAMAVEEMRSILNNLKRIPRI